MLSFTHQNRNTGMKTGFNQPDFKPIIITNKAPKQISPRKDQKVVKKVTENRNFTQQNWKPQQPKQFSQSKQSFKHKGQWNTGGVVKGAFDKKIKRDELAAEQRKLRAQMKRQKQLLHQQIVINEKRIGTKGIKMLKQKDEQIQYLKQMIQKEKQQKAKIDKVYQQRKMEIQKERHELIELQRRIQKQGIKEKKVIQQIKKISSPQKDGIQIKNKQQIINRDKQRMKAQRKDFQEPTQSQYLHQKNELRQKQLQYLITQRQKCVQGLPNINYTPSLIPLLSKASYKIISTHVSQIVELLVDDLLEQQVCLLQQIELEEAKQKQERRNKEIVQQYQQMIVDFVQQNQEIGSKIGKYSSMNFMDIYKPKHYPEQPGRSGFNYDNPVKKIFRKITLDNLDEDHLEQIQDRKNRFIRFVSNFDQYKKSNIQMFQQCTQEIIDAAIEKLAKQLDKGSGEFVDIVFRNQFN